MTPEKLSFLLGGGIVILGIIAVLFWKMFAYVRAQAVEILNAWAKSDDFRIAVRSAMDPVIETAGRNMTDAALRSLTTHDNSKQSHSEYRIDASSAVSTSIRDHNESPVAHHVALANYIDDDQLNGATQRLELVMESVKVSTLTVFSALKDEVGELRKELGVVHKLCDEWKRKPVRREV